MGKQNPAFVAFNRGILSPKALGRVDLDRTQLSAETMTNWLPKTQGAMSIRPGTKYLGSSFNDSGAEFIEFAASTDQTALVEITDEKARIWLRSDTGNTWETPASGTRGVLEVPLARPAVNTTVALTDTGWSNTSTGGTLSNEPSDAIPAMTAQVTSGVEITASSSEDDSNGGRAWNAADNDNDTHWQDTGTDKPSTLPSWWSVDFDNAGTDTGRRVAVHSYSIRAPGNSARLKNAPRRWSLLTSNFDTGTFATDTGKWTLEDTQGSENDWGVSEKREYTPPGADTGTIPARRHWRLNFLQANGGTELRVAEIEMFPAAAAVPSQQVTLQGGSRIFNAQSIGALARLQKTVVVSDTGTEHSLDIHVSRGPLTLRVGSTSGADDYIKETQIGTGYHNLAFNPDGNFHITLQSDEIVNRTVASLEIGDSGSVELIAPWTADNLNDIRYDQSADVVYVDCNEIKPQKIERRGTGRSWSVVEYEPNNGPFLPVRTSAAKLRVSKKYGNTRMRSDIPFFREEHTGALFRLFHHGQSGIFPLGAKDAATDAIEVVGIADTGEPSTNSERVVRFDVTGTWSGTVQVERSFEGPELGFHPASGNFMKDHDTGTFEDNANATATDTGTFLRFVFDQDDNVKVWYRAKMLNYTSGVALVNVTHKSGGVHGIARITEYVGNQEADIEVLSRFSDTGQTDNWQEGDWSARQGYPSAVALHAGRLAHAKRGNLYMSVSDDYENFDEQTEGDAGPLNRTLGSGPVDDIVYLLSLLRLVIGTSGAEIELRSSSLDEPVTPENSSARAFSTQGSANVRAIKIDTNGIFVQRSGQRVFLISAGSREVSAFAEYGNSELTMLVPDLLEAGVVSVGIQRQPDTRLHCVLANGKVGILTYDPEEEVLCWSMWETDGSVERVAILPATGEDKVYYHVNRTINGATKRFLERWATEDETKGDTGLTYLMDCAVKATTNGTATVSGLTHLVGESVIAVAQDTGQAAAMRDLSYDTGGVQNTYTVSGGGAIVLDTGNFTNVVVGLPYTPTWKSTKLAYAAEQGTALAQMKRTDKIGFVLHQTHNRGIYFGNDTGKLDPLPRNIDQGATVDNDKIFDHLDQFAMPFPGLWNTDSRIVIRGRAPRPATVLAAVPTVATNEK